MDRLIFVLVMLILMGMSRWAERRFRSCERLPMQWGLHGQVNWTMRRKPALMIAPAIGAVSMGLVLLQGKGTGTVAVVGGAVVAAHLFHIWMINRRVG